MARYVLPTSDSSAREHGSSDASSDVQPPTPGRITSTELRGNGSADVPPVPSPGEAPTTGAHTAPLPTKYRGKSSGEFQRVAPTGAPDASALIEEAELHLLTLPASDRNRRLLEVAILRRDTALLGGLLEAFRRQEI